MEIPGSNRDISVSDSGNENPGTSCKIYGDTELSDQFFGSRKVEVKASGATIMVGHEWHYYLGGTASLEKQVTKKSM